MLDAIRASHAESEARMQTEANIARSNLKKLAARRKALTHVAVGQTVRQRLACVSPHGWVGFDYRALQEPTGTTAFLFLELRVWSRF